jgi:renalase
MSVTADILIVGAGIAGLMAADVLRDYNVVLLDKGRGVGGRLATRRIGPGLADHGAQFFTVRDPEFGDYVQRWRDAGLVYEWAHGWLDADLNANRDGHPRYAVRGGLNALAKHLARDQQVRTEVQITAVLQEADGWTLNDTAGNVYTARALVLTPPVPQSLALLDAGNVILSASDRASLEQIEYSPCLAGMFWMQNSPGLPEPSRIIGRRGFRRRRW